MKYGTIFTAEVDRDILGGLLFLENENNIRWLIGASKRLDVDRDKAVLIGCANRLMIWEAIQYAKQKVIKEFDLGGYYTGNDMNDPRNSINTFKRGFGGRLVRAVGAWDRVYAPVRYRLYRWMLDIRGWMLEARK